MYKSLRILLALCMLGAFSMVFTGCGGGGGGSSDVPEIPEMTPEEPEEPEVPEVEVTPSVDLMGLPVPAGSYDIAAGATQTVGSGEDEVTLSCSAAADCSFAVADDGAAVATSGEATAALTAAAMQAIADREEAEAAAARAAAQAKAGAIASAIADPDGDGKPGIPASVTTETELTHKRPGEEIHLKAGGALAVGDVDSAVTDAAVRFATADELGENDTDIRNTQEFQANNQARISLGSGYEASVYQRTKDKKTDTLTIYSNVEPAKSQHWNVYDWANEGGLTAETQGDPANQTDSSKVVYDHILIAGTSTDPIDSDIADQMTGSKIPRGAGTNTEVTTTDNDFDGTLYGVPGEYECTGGSACTLTRDEDGDLVITGSFKFVPSETKKDTQDDHVIEGAIPDTDYLIFGYWMQQQTAAQGGTKYGVGVFADGRVDYDVSGIASLMGTATYSGPATGMYARKDLSVEDGNVVATPAAAGQFSADANLTAHFGNTADPAVNGSDKISPAEALKISGTISNFMDSAGDEINASWSLSLDAAPLSGDTFTGGTYKGTTTGSGSSSGSWAGQFYGTGTTPAGAALDAAVNYPLSAAGEFTGHFTDGHVIGAFGASR